MERVAAEMRQLKEWKDGVMRGDIAISPQPHSANTQPANPPPAQSSPALSLSPISPVPSPSSRQRQSSQQQQQARLTSSHRLKRYSSFSSFPQLLSHFQHNENDLVRAADGLEAAMDGWTDADMERKEEEVQRANGGGYDREVAGVEGEVERLMDGFVNEALEERWAAVMEKEKELEARKKQREERARERDAATRRAMDRLTVERQTIEQADADRRHQQVIDSVERERELQRVEHERQVMAAQQAQLMAAEQFAAHQQLLAHQAAQLSLYSQPTPPQPIVQSQQSAMDEQRFLLDKQNALRAAQQQQHQPQQQQQLPSVAQSAAIAQAAAAVATQRRGALAPAYNAVEEISDIEDSEDDNSPMPVYQHSHKPAEEQKQPSPSTSLLSPPHSQQPRIHDSDEIESISLSQPVSPIPHVDDSAIVEQRATAASSPAKLLQPVQLNAVRRVGGGFMLPAVTAKPVPGVSGGAGVGLASGPRPNALLRPIDQTRAVVRDLSDELELDEEEF